MRAMFKMWLDNNGKAFGEGPLGLLKGIERTGSLRQAAREIGMSYRKAWLILHRCEERLGFALVERRTGGAAGGGSRLTAAASDLVARYEGFRKEAGELLESLFQKHFVSDASADKT